MALANSNFSFTGQTSHYRGKVRDVYGIGERYLVMVASDRISAFDVILPRPVPYKGQVLNQTAAYFLKATADLVPNWLISTPDPNVAIGYRATPFPVEMVIRGYLAGHAWREYRSGKRSICGVSLPDGLRENDKLPEPIITPTTKAHEGHDMDISREDLLRQGLVSEAHYLQLEAYTRSLFTRGTQMAADKGLILVDTKYEFGLYEGRVLLIDEVHTPDSSRYFYADGYELRQAAGEEQKQLSKEFVRQWLIANGFQGQEGQRVPAMDDVWLETISQRYMELYEKITGMPFEKADISEMEARVYGHVEAALRSLK
ncbi:MAG: phosphoribosylaminoimidazolesuccinocarboxamide synthase [Bacteroidia bacterium]